MTGLDDLLRCPAREDGGDHEWAGTDPAKGGDDRNSCRHCGTSGRDNFFKAQEGGFFARATAARYAMVAALPGPMVSGSGKPRDLTAAQQAKAEEIVADKKRRDAEAVANGTARPGQLSGAPKGKPS